MVIHTRPSNNHDSDHYIPMFEHACTDSNPHIPAHQYSNDTAQRSSDCSPKYTTERLSDAQPHRNADRSTDTHVHICLRQRRGSWMGWQLRQTASEPRRSKYVAPRFRERRHLLERSPQPMGNGRPPIRPHQRPPPPTTPAELDMAPAVWDYERE